MNKSNSIQILCFGFANLYPVQKICFVSTFCPTVFLLCSKDLFCGFDLTYGVQTICFVNSFWNLLIFFFQNYFFCINLEEFVYENYE